MSASCTVCGGSETYQLVRREAVPVAQNLLLATREEALACITGSLAMRRCSSCGFSWNEEFDAGLLDYGASYDNDQSFSPLFGRHLGQVADAVARRLSGSDPLDLLEIGCGQGGFLGALAARLGASWRSGLGFDPAWKGDSAALPERTEVRGCHFEAGALEPGERPKPNAVVSRHVIEHLPDPVGHLRAIRSAVSEGIPIFVETPDVDWTLRNGAVFDFHYEHCSLFTDFALRLALERSGFIVEEVRRVFGDQYLFATARAGATLPAPSPAQGRFSDLGYRAARERFLSALEALLDHRRSSGGVALWGAASKGVMIALMLPETPQLIACAIDINERKQGCFMPSSGVPILSPAEAAQSGVRTAIVVNPQYLGEVRAYCAGEGLPIEIISIEAAECNAAEPEHQAGGADRRSPAPWTASR